MNLFRLIGSVALAAIGIGIAFASDIINVIRMESYSVPDSDELKKLPFGKRY